MSYDVSISVKVEGIDYYITLYELGNITWNVRELILKSSGWDIENEASNGAVLPWIEKIERGYRELINNPEKYRKYESSNRWGTINDTISFYNNCLVNARQWLKEEYNEDLKKVAVIYVC